MLSSPGWHYGPLLALGSGIGYTASIFSMKVAMRSKTSREQSACRPLWLFGLLLFVVGAGCEAGALLYAPQSLIAPLAGATMLMTLIGAPWLLGEHRQRNYGIIWRCTLIIFAGCALATLAGPKTTEVFSLDAVMALYERVDFILFETVTVGLLLAGFLLVKAAGNSVLYHEEGKAKFFMPLFFSYTAAWAGAQQAMVLKALLSLLSGAVDGKWPFWSPELIMMAAVCLLLTVTQAAFLFEGLRRYAAAFFTPVYTAQLVVMNVFAGAFYFGEFETFSATDWAVFAAGVVVVLWGTLGILLLTTDADGPSGLAHIAVGIYRAFRDGNWKHVGDDSLYAGKPHERAALVK